MERKRGGEDATSRFSSCWGFSSGISPRPRVSFWRFSIRCARMCERACPGGGHGVRRLDCVRVRARARRKNACGSAAADRIGVRARTYVCATES